MTTTARREPLAPINPQAGNRLSLAGAGPLKPSADSRLSVASRRESVNGRPSVAAFSRPSLGGGGAPPRKSVIPGPPANNRLSVGGTGTNNRRLSTSAAPLSKAADPRPSGKDFTAQCVKTISTYLTNHEYPGNCSTKLLNSPTGADFKNMMTFLICQIDHNFQFGRNMEEEFRLYMKQFGYPTTISKTALIPVGSPHTWPSVLAAMAWFVDYLNFIEALAKSKNEPQIVVPCESENEEPKQEDISFEHIVRCYHKFMEGDEADASVDEDGASMDEDLVHAYHEKYKRVSAMLVPLNAKVDALKKKKSQLMHPEAEIKKRQAARDAIKADQDKLVQFLAQLREHNAQLAAQVAEKRQIRETHDEALRGFEKETLDLEETLSKQEFTPSQVQQMNHKRNLLRETLETLEKQKQAAVTNLCTEETGVKDTHFELADRVTTFNTLAMSLELTPATARNARGTDYALKINSQATDTRNLVGLDLTKTVKPALTTLKKHLASEISKGNLNLREMGTRFGGLQELREEHERWVKSLQERMVKQEEAYRQAKGGCDEEIADSADKIEDMERQLNQMKLGQSRILEETETRIHNLDNEFLQQRQMHMAAREKLLDEINETIGQVLEHKARTTKLLNSVLDGVTSTKESLQREKTARTPGKPSRPDKAN